MCRDLHFADGTWNVPATSQLKSVPLGVCHSAHLISTLFANFKF